MNSTVKINIQYYGITEIINILEKISYGAVGEHRQGEIIQRLSIKKSTVTNVDEIAEAVARKLKEL